MGTKCIIFIGRAFGFIQDGRHLETQGPHRLTSRGPGTGRQVLYARKDVWGQLGRSERSRSKLLLK